MQKGGDVSLKDAKTNYYVRQVLSILMDGDIVSTGKIASEIGLSEKSTRNKLSAIEDYLRDNDLGEICKKPRVGIWLEADEKQRSRIVRMLESSDEISVSYDAMERMMLTLKRLFRMLPNETMTTQQLANELYVSTPTVLKVIKECEEWLGRYHIVIVNERNRGLRMQYEENNYRVALKNLIMGKGDLEEIRKNMFYFFGNLDVNLIKKCIIETENEWNYRFTDDSFHEILIYCCLAYQRKDFNSHLRYDNEELELIQRYNEYPFTVAIFKKLHEKMHILVSNEEVVFLSIQIMCSKFIGRSELSETLGQVKQYDDKLIGFVNRMLDVIGNILDVDLLSDEKLKESLIFHLRPTIFRIRYGTPQSTSLVPFIKKEYKNVFRATWAISILFEETYGLQITEDELGYIVLYIQSAIERKTRQYRVCLLTDSSRGHAQLLVERLRKLVPEINEIRVEGIHDFKLEEQAEMDMIITPHSLPFHDKRIVEISNILSDGGILKLRSHMEELNLKTDDVPNPFSPICFPLFSPDLIFMNLDVKDKTELLIYLSQQMENKGFVTGKFCESVLEREKATTTSIGNGVSLPHGAQSEVNNSKVVIATLKNPILWNDDLVDVVFLLGFKMDTPDEVKRIQVFYKQYISLVETDEKVQKLKQMKSNVELYKYLIQ